MMFFPSISGWRVYDGFIGLRATCQTHVSLFSVVASLSVLCSLLVYPWRLRVALLCAPVGTLVNQYGCMGYVIVWCGVWFDEDSTFVGELVCIFVGNDSGTCSYILDSDSMWGPCH